MTDFILYSLKSTLCLAVFYGFYKLFLAKETHVKRNRFYLLASVLFSLTLPVINFTVDHQELATTHHVIWEFENSIHEQLTQVDVDPSQETIFETAFWIKLSYLLGVFIFLGHFILNLVSIFKIIRANEKIKEGALNLVYLEQVHSPYSFFNYVFLNPSILSKTENKQILLHESIHSKQLHSIDLLIIELLKVFFWFNPIIYLLKNALVEVHEYCADQACVVDQTNKIDYQQCLLQHIESKMNFNLTSAFKTSLTLKRIKMIKKSNTSVWAHLKLILILPVLIVSMLSFDYSEVNSEIKIDLNSGQFTSPIKASSKVRISSPYGNRMHPIKKKRLFHKGVDISAPKGTPIYAIADGVVTKRQDHHIEGKSYGRFLILEHAGDMASLYAQLEAYVVNVGQKVRKGDIIGFVGSSGMSTGAHLHLEVKLKGQHVDPMNYFDLN